MRVCGMRTGIIIDVTPADRRRLGETVADRNIPQKHVRRARIVLLTADGAGTAEIMREAGVSKTAVWRWQERFMQEGVDGLLRDKTRPSRIPSARGRDRRSCDRPDPGRPAGRGDAPDGPGDGRSRRHQRQPGAAHLALAWASAAPGAPVQAFQGPPVRRQGQRHRRPLCRSARPRRGAVGGREVPDPGARPHPAGPAVEEGSGRGP